MTKILHVAVGVIRNDKNQFLISKRHDHLHQGGLWEFPGGKVEANEAVFAALYRELHEELSINITHAKPLIKISHQYVDKHVLLDVWIVSEYEGLAMSEQRQPIQWVPYSELSDYTFPAANQAIIKSLSLPPYYAITGEFKNKDDYFRKFKTCLDNGVKLIQLRYKGSNISLLTELAKDSKILCDEVGAKLLVNSNSDFIKTCNVDGIHLSSLRLHQYSSRPISESQILAASVHTEEDLLQAIKINADFVVVSPVFNTTSHPGAITLGLDGLSSLINNSGLVVYALGGMKKDMLDEVKQSGAYGIAAISAFWK